MIPEQSINKYLRRYLFWKKIRVLFQALILIVFVLLFISTRRNGIDADLANVLLHFDPLLTLTNLLSSRIIILASSISILTILLTIAFGRVWCGWICPLGTILDVFSLKKWRQKDRTPDESWRRIKYSALFIILFSALFGNLTLLILDPLTILYRTFTTSIWPASSQILFSLEKTLYQVQFLEKPISTLDSWLRPSIFPSQAVFYNSSLLFAVVIAFIVLLNLFAPRFWCRYLCPLGGLLSLISKFAIFRRVVKNDCKSCAICSSNCPTGTIDPTRGYQSDPGECTMCLQCFVECPRSTVGIKAQPNRAAWFPYNPARREFLASAGAGIALVALSRSDGFSARKNDHLIRPPGVIEDGFLSKCIRCGECMRVCPTRAIQPALAEASFESLWTPVIIPRLGYCEFSCNSCGQICPVQAIPLLDLEEKRKQVIGSAYIDKNRCIAWADQKDCIVCEEMCPVVEKAIKLVPTDYISQENQKITVQLPVVLRNLCIGCGICEYKCPVKGESAIRVYIPNSIVLV